MKLKIKNYLNIYQYLQDVYLERKAQDSGFSYEAWAQELRASDKSYIRMMVLGKRPLNAKMTGAFADSLQFEKEDRDFFFALTEYTQSKTQEQKNIFGKKLVSLLRSDLERLEIQAHYDFLSNPLLPRLQVFLGFSDLDQAPKNLAWLLQTTEEEIQGGIAKLLELGLIQKEKGLLRPVQKSFKVADHFGDLGLEAFYTHNLEAAKEAIRLPKESRRFKSLLLPLNPEEFEKYLLNLQSFVSEQIYSFNPDELANRTLYQVHFNIIPVSAPSREPGPAAEADL
jgi:uncharacterized protein (TIGR02147 family)